MKYLSDYNQFVQTITLLADDDGNINIDQIEVGDKEILELIIFEEKYNNEQIDG